MSTKNTKTRKENSSEDKASRRKRRAERNKMRTIKHIHKLLDSFQGNVLRGFSHDGWGDAASTFRQLSPFLAPEEYNALGHVWRNTWTQEPSPETVTGLVNAIKARVETDHR